MYVCGMHMLKLLMYPYVCATQWHIYLLHGNVHACLYCFSSQESALIGTSCKIFLQTQNRLEMALLTYLRNTNLHNVQISLTCFQFLVQLTEVLMTTGEPCPVPFANNIKPYQALADASKNLLIGELFWRKIFTSHGEGLYPATYPGVFIMMRYSFYIIKCPKHKG